jgi:pimeloyl-ACP methyl ester carboxylesterase
MADQVEVATPDGRILAALTEGDPDGFPLVYHLGTPGGAVPFPLLDRAARTAGLRVLAYSRPGYGASTPWPYTERGPRIADDVVDVLALLHHFGIDEFVTLGWSGGGPRALACAAILPGRCLAAATLGGVAPYDADGLDWYAGMGAENVEGFEVAARGAAPYHALLRQEEGSGEPEPRTAEQIRADLGELLTPLDAGFMTGEFAAYWDGFGRTAREQGVGGMRDDGLALVGDWGFDVADISVPVSVWHGRQDGLVPFAHGEWLARQIPGARPHLLGDQGHLTLWGLADDVLADLRDLAGL